MCLVALENSIFRICISVDWKKQAFDPEIILQFYFHFKWIPERERERERARTKRSYPTTTDRAPLRQPQTELRTDDDRSHLHRSSSDPPTVSFLHSDPPFMSDPPSHLPKIHPQTHKQPIIRPTLKPINNPSSVQSNLNLI